ncbi:MAG: ADP-ribosylglycohydrolase family protein [Armatimonadetes bacterium]|nr:ADP-ribosylglycohydrolase family protein [Armatimonadota bacterium]
MSDRVTNALWGALAGATLGSPLHGKSGPTKLSFYQPVPNRMAPTPELDLWWAFLDSFSEDANPSSLSGVLSEHSLYRDGSLAFAAANIARGLVAPASGSFENPLASDATARPLLWGVLFPGRPKIARMWAQFDASLDHSQDGVHVPSALAAALASANEGCTALDLVRAITDSLSADSLGHRAVSLALKCAGEPDPVQKLLARAPESLPGVDQLSATSALAQVVLGLAVGRDFGSAVLTACSAGGAARSVGLATGAIAGVVHQVPEEWRDPLGTDYVAGHGLRDLSPPATIEEFAEALLKKVVPAPAPAQVALVLVSSEAPQTGEDVPPPIPAPAEEPVDPDVPLWQLPAQSESQCWQQNGLDVTWTYLNGVRSALGRSLKASVTLQNTGEAAKDVSVSVSCPPGWTLATNGFSGSLAPKEATTFGVVAQSPEDPQSGLILKVDDVAFNVPVVPERKWFAAGPFDDPAQRSFDTSFPPERSQRRGDRFSGRSNMPIDWHAVRSGMSFEPEPLFMSGPGVVILWAKARFTKACRLTMVASGAPGVIVRVDGSPVVRYLDSHVPTGRNKAPYAASIEVQEESEFLVKLIRDRQPAAPFLLYFLDDNGDLVEPTAWLDLPE